MSPQLPSSDTDGLPHRLPSRSFPTKQPPRKVLVTSATAPSTPSAIVFVVEHDSGAPLRYRVQIPAAGLKALGHTVDLVSAFDPDLAQKLARADAAVVYRTEATPHLERALAAARKANPGLVTAFDIDDPTFVNDDTLSRNLLRTMRACGALLSSTPEIATMARRTAGIPAADVPNGFHPVMGRICDAQVAKRRLPGGPRLAFMDGTGASPRAKVLEEPVARILRENKRASIWLYGIVDAPAAWAEFGSRVHQVPMMDWQDLPGWIRQMDLVLAPNNDSQDIADTKSNIKWVEAGLVETPTLATATEPYRQVVREGENGYLVEGNSADAWTEALRQILADKSGRRRAGKKARQDILATLTAQDVARNLLTALTDLAEEGLSPIPEDLPAASEAPARDLNLTLDAERAKPPLGKKVVLKTILGRN